MQVCSTLINPYAKQIFVLKLKLFATNQLYIMPFASSKTHNISSTYIFNIQAKINGQTIVASDSTINFGVCISNLPQVIFSFGTAPE